jgi:formiminotetrahydrofolate cyclodeaminase
MLASKAVLNVKINLPNIKDDKFKKDIIQKIDQMRVDAVKYRDKVLDVVNEKISK